MDVLKEMKEMIFAVAVALILYNAASLLFGTHVPVTAVVSTSMEHTAQFGGWWTMKEREYSAFNVTKEEFLSYPYNEGMYVGDMVLVMNATIRKGDVIVYHPATGCFDSVKTTDTIIHRVVSTEPLLTKGDNNPGPDVKNGKSCIVSIEGKAVIGVPLLGYPRMLLFRMTGI
ncbi:MAG: hypothetical protein HY365_03365 [Candidatus Aenigmarchaeota archaeon]|nr:hypothetical protein [Candidatus Aenigmarchaeota archaeon]